MINSPQRIIIATLFLRIAILNIYFNVQYFEFVNYDDHQYISENRIDKK